MKRYRVIYTVLFLITGYLFVHEPVVEYTVLFFFLMLFPWICRVVLVLSTGDNSLEILTKKELKTGETAEICLSADGGFGIGRARANLLLHNLFTGETSTYMVELFPEQGRFMGRLELACGRCGRIEVTDKYLDFLDWTGLGRRRRFLNASVEIYVFPKNISDHAVFPEFALPAEYLTCGPDEPAEIRGLKKYKEGDSLNRIHWKMSAKFGSVLVKEYDSYMESSLILMPDFAGVKEEDVNRILEHVVFISRYLLLAGKEHWIGMISNGKLERFYVDHEESHRRALCGLLSMPYDSGQETSRLMELQAAEKKMQLLKITAPRVSGP